MTDASKPPEPEQTEPAEQTEGTEQPESQAEPAQPESAEESQKPKMSKLAVLSVVCFVAAFAVLVIYLKSGEASIPLAVEKMLFPAGAVVLGIALVAGVIALVMIKTSGGALSGRRLALLGIIVPIVSAVAFMRTSPGTCYECVPVSPAQQCRSNIRQLASEINKYRDGNEGRFPQAERWCDVLLEQMGADPSRRGLAAADESLFKCPLQKGARCSYSLNKFAAEAGADIPEDMVLLFESGPGWNQVGGPELLTTEYHKGIGCNFLFADGHAAFIKKEELDTLRWEP